MSESLKHLPEYSDGFFDAQAGEPLFDGAHEAYEAGWRAFYRVQGLMEEAGFTRVASGGWSKTTVIARATGASS